MPKKEKGPFFMFLFLRNTAIFILALFAFVCITAQPASAKWSDRWKIATLAPDGVGWARQIKAIVIPAVTEISDKNLKIHVYWGGIMGDDEDYIKKMRIDQLQGAGLSGQGTKLAVPEMSVVELPFLFNNYDEVDYIKSKMSGTFDRIAADNGYFLVAWIDQDFDRLYAVGSPLETLHDYAKIRPLSWFGPIEAATYRTLGTTPVSVTMPEAPSTLRQGIGNAIIAPAAWVVGTQLYNILTHISPLNLRYAPALIVVTSKRWETMPQEYRKNYHERRPAVMDEFSRELRRDNVKAYEAMIAYGLREAAPSQEVADTIRERMLPLWEEMAGNVYPRHLLKELLGHLEEYRSR
ncbi:MAG: TRAP transporter substrate-binding protein DctP [Desulfatibacillaceae bacterium]|nr:TRAP transporter substrate-binding protein DctP [Desulfatibacillaceae bacterium]